MATWKDITTYKKADIIRIVNDDFKTSEESRLSKNKENLNHLKTFNCIDLEQRLGSVPFASSDENLGDIRTYLDSSKPVRNKYFPPEARAVVLTAVDRMMGALFPNNDSFLKVYKRHNGDEKAAMYWEPLLHEIYRQMEYIEEARMGLTAAMLFDCTYMQVGWTVEPGAVPRFHPKGLDLKEAERRIAAGKKLEQEDEVWWEIEQDAISLPSAKFINTFNIRPDPSSIHGSIEKSGALFFGITAKVPKSVIYNMAANNQLSECSVTNPKRGASSLLVGGKKIADEEPCGGDNGDITVDFEKVMRTDLKIKNDEDIKAEGSPNHFRVSYYYQPFGEVMLLNGKDLAHKKTNSGWNLIKLTAYENQGTYSGYSLMRDQMHSQFDITTMCRARRNRQDINSYPRAKVDVDQFNNWEEAMAAINADPDLPLLYHGNRAVRTGQEPVSYLVNNLPPEDTLQEQQNEQQFAREVAGVTDTAMGGGPSTVRPATELHLQDVGMNRRESERMRKFSDALIIKPSYMILKECQTNMTQPMAIELIGEDGIHYHEVSREMIAFRKIPIIRITGPDYESKRAESRDKMLETVKIFGMSPIFSQFLRTKEVMKAVYDYMDQAGHRFVQLDMTDDYSPSPEQELKLLAIGYAPAITGKMGSEASKRRVVLANFTESDEFDKLRPERRAAIRGRADNYLAIENQQGMGGLFPGDALNNAGTGANQAGNEGPNAGNQGVVNPMEAVVAGGTAPTQGR